MSLSSEAQALFDHAKNSIPRWVTSGIQTAMELLYGYTSIFDATRTQLTEWLGITLLSTTGRPLEQHAKDRGTSKRENETDDVLRARLRQIEDAVTDPALQEGINAILGGTITVPANAWIEFGINGASSDLPQVEVPAGAYTYKEFLTYLRGNFPYEGFNVQIVNRLMRFTYTDPDNLDHTFSVIFSDTTFRDLLGFTALTTFNWDPAVDGYFQSTTELDATCALVTLRRDRGHFHDGGGFADPTTISSATVIDCLDEVTTPTITVEIPAGTYTRAEMQVLIQDQLTAESPDWVYTLDSATGQSTFMYGAGADIFTVLWDNVTTRAQFGYMQDSPGDTVLPYVSGQLATSFMNRGYRMGYAQRPMTYIAILPNPTTTATAAAVEEYLRQFGPAGFIYIVEYDLTP